MNKTILIVDDAPGIRLLLKSYLEPAGYDLLFAVDADTATQQLKQRIHLAILDVKLPGNVMGNELMTRLQNKRATADIPIIMISGLPAMEDALQELDKNVVFIQKPFTKEQLVEKVDALLGNIPTEADTGSMMS